MRRLRGLQEAGYTSHRETDLTGFRTLRKEAPGGGWIGSKGQSYQPPHQVIQLLGSMCRKMENRGPDGLPAAALKALQWNTAQPGKTKVTPQGLAPGRPLQSA